MPLRLLAVGVCLTAWFVSTYLLAALLIPKHASIEKSAKIITECFWGHFALLMIMCAIKCGWTRLPEGQRLLKAILNSVITLGLSVSSTLGGLHFEENAKAIGWLVALNIMVCSGMAFVQIALNAMDDFGVNDFVTAMLLGVVAHLNNNADKKWYIIILVGLIGVPRHWIDYFHRRLHPPAQQVPPPPPQQGNPEPVDPQAPQVNPEPLDPQAPQVNPEPVDAPQVNPEPVDPQAPQVNPGPAEAQVAEQADESARVELEPRLAQGESILLEVHGHL